MPFCSTVFILYASKFNFKPNKIFLKEKERQSLELTKSPKAQNIRTLWVLLGLMSLIQADNDFVVSRFCLLSILFNLD